MTKVKICGITNLEDARFALDCGADELGFNFYEKSRRYIAPATAATIVEQLSIETRTVGVFVNEPIETVLDISRSLGLQGVQLHGDEDRLYIKTVLLNSMLFVIKAFRVAPGFLISSAVDWKATYELFDAFSPHERGGTGRSLDWEELGIKIQSWFPDSAYLAGGLTPDNVETAIRMVRPYAVDVASGVESSPGKKDPNKIEAFIRNAKIA
ncbi:MAG: phosphoribosylanthranilate isomerase [Blastocatellia bacterium]|nr:phosphoribosylanthranilate isomerase [Blastocatellia bacterium]